MTDWAEAARAALAEGPTALVTILATEGSAPRGQGTRMVVTLAASMGTIGGGKLELGAVRQARAILALPAGAWRVQDYPLGPMLGQCCGGRVRLLVEHLADVAWVGRVGDGVLTVLEDNKVIRLPRHPGLVPGSTVVHNSRSGGREPRWMPEQVRHDEGEAIAARGPLPAVGARFIEPSDALRQPVLLFGAGHVGQAVARLLPGLPFHLGWFDSRTEMAERAGVAWVADDALPDCIAGADAAMAVLIMTHDHDLDYRLTASALRSAAGFVGLIGSATKRARFLARLARDGFDAEQQARLTCPIGLPGIVGKEPGIIAIAAVAQLLSLRDAA